jgi:putative membrane protein
MRLILRILINMAAIWVALRLVPGISFTGDWKALVGVALVLAVINAVVAPIIKILSLPFIVLTLGLFTFVINALLLLLTSAISTSLGLGFHVSGFFPALLGSLVISLVSAVLTVVLADRKKEERA